MVHPWSGVDTVHYYGFVDNIKKCKQEMFFRPTIANQYFALAMDHLHDIEVQDPDIGETIQNVGSDFEIILKNEHTRRGVSYFPKYLKD